MKESLNNNFIKLYSRDAFGGEVFAERLNRTICNFIKEPFFDRRNANWFDEIPNVFEKRNDNIHMVIKRNQYKLQEIQ